MSTTQTASPVKIAVRHLRGGDKLAMTGETVIAVQPVRGYGRNHWAATHRALTLENAAGVRRLTHWNASTQVSIYPR